VAAGKDIGLITNMTGVDRQLRSDIDLLAARHDLRLVKLFGPEHGVRGDAQAGMHVDSSRDASTGLPVFSLYGTTREPTPAMLAGLGALVFDIQDIGTRYYTYPTRWPVHCAPRVARGSRWWCWIGRTRSAENGSRDPCWTRIRPSSACSRFRCATA
jgi:hypothetical protein